MHQIIRKYSRGLLAAILAAVTLTGCVYDDGACPDVPEPGRHDSDVSISFKVATNRDMRTRAADLDGDQQGSQPEDYIDVGNMQFLLFDSDQKFLRFLTPTVTMDRTGEYTVMDSFEEPYFENAADGSSVGFYIMSLANGYSMGAVWAGATRGVTSISDLCGVTQNTVLTAKPVPSLLMNANQDIEGVQRFPMSGLQNFTVAVSDLKASTREAPVDLSAGVSGRTLYMLRALAKIEIIDKANYTGGFTEAVANDAVRIEKAELDGFFSRGCQLPAYSQWMRGDVTLPETQQVIAPSVPRTCTYLNPPAFSENNDEIGAVPDNVRIDFVPDEYAQSLRADKAPVFSGYVYEYADPSDGIAITQPPYIRVTTKGDGSDGSSLILPFRLGVYEDGKYKEKCTQLLRNHIYRYEITSVNTTSRIVVNWTVCDMDKPADITIPPFE